MEPAACDLVQNHKQKCRTEQQLQKVRHDLRDGNATRQAA
jgi:hypothetical protein